MPSATLKDAWAHFRLHPQCTSLADCGILRNSRTSKTPGGESLHQAMETRKESLNRQMTRLSGGNRAETRALGFNFTDSAYWKNKPSPKLSKEEKVAKGPVGSQTTVQHLVFFLLAHVLYDQDKLAVSFHSGLDELRGMVPQVFFEKVTGWLFNKRHCRHSFWASSMTKQVAGKAALLTGDARSLFLVLIVSACNHRAMIEESDAIASEGYSPETKTKVFGALMRHGRWLASPRDYPVSSGTAYRCGLSGEDGLAPLVNKVINLSLGVFSCQL